MSWLNYADDAARRLPSSFRDSLDRIASGRYNLKDVAEQERRLRIAAKNAAQSAYTDADLSVYRELGDTFQAVDLERALQQQALSDMADDTLRQANPSMMNELDDLDRIGYRAEIDSMWLGVPLADRKRVAEQIVQMGGIDALSADQLRQLRDYVAKNQWYPRQRPIVGE
jgi:hypothetical protein